MSAKLDSQKLSAVFSTRPDILDNIKNAADSPARITLFNDIAAHVYDRFQEAGEPATKRRKIEGGQSQGIINGVKAEAGNPADEEVLLVVKEISVSVPQRKKFELCMTASYLYARAPGTTAPIPAITYAWSDMEYGFYLAVPEKAQVQHNYVLIPRGASIPSPKGDSPVIEPLVFTIPATPPKSGTIGGGEASTAAAVSDTYKSLFHWAFDRRLKAAGNTISITAANPQKFHSVVRQPHRPNEKAVHVGAYKGSKDGFLFFLENGILWGFKKPLIFIPLNRILAMSYTNILQITFNIVVEVLTGDGDATEEFEFSMIDQQDYGGIDDYIKINKLQDRSMAEQRKAKLQLAENKKGVKKEGEEGVETTEGGENGMTELEQAHLEVEQQLQDDEDEDEEDYDPGTDGESEGSGSSSEEDDSDAEGEDDGEAEAEDDEEEEEEVVEQKPVVKQEVVPPPAVPKPAPKAAPRAASRAAPKAAAPKPAPVAVRQGWATTNQPPPADTMDVDEEFDVVG